MHFIRALLVLLCLALPAAAQDGTITTDSTMAEDAAIATRIRDIIAGLGGYEDVTVQVSDGIVTLRGTTTSAVEIAALDTLATRVEGVVAVKNQVTETTDIARRLDPAVDRFMARVDQLITVLPLALIALAVFTIISFTGSRIARLRQPWDRIAPNAFIADLYRQMVSLVFMVVGLVIALDIMNATALLGTILGAAGIIGLALGFAVKDTVENYIASIMLSIRQPFRPNDVVEIDGDEGKVIRLTSRATILLSFDGNHIRIPNATVFKSRIVNYSQNNERRFMFRITIDSNADLAAARDLATKTVQQMPFTLTEPTPLVWIDTFNDAGVELVVTGWIDQTKASINLAKGETMRQVKLAFESAGIGLPDKTYHLRLENAEPDTPAAHIESPEIANVEAVSESSLDKMIHMERKEETTEDLLRGSAQKE